MEKKCIVIFSGGMDSAICLAQAIKDHGPDQVSAISFDYGQRHSKELEAAQKICLDWNIDHKIINLSFLNDLTNNALTNKDIDVNGRTETGTVNTLVLGRNGMFLRVAAIYGGQFNASNVYVGINELDNVEYRDCSREYMDITEKALQIDLNNNQFKIVTPISKLNKKEIFEYGNKITDLKYILEHTITCYNGIPREGCKTCLACKLKHEGLAEFKKENPEFNSPY